ncbi:MAG: CHAT domain-containing tetratricopeptide repeat protein [Caldilineaceae bacterium]
MTELVTASSLLDKLLAQQNVSAQKQLLKQHLAALQNDTLTDALATALKAQADHSLRTKLARAKVMATLIHYLSELTNNPLYAALALRVEGNILGIGEGKFPEAVACYDRAAIIYQEHNRLDDVAKTQVGKIGCLALIGRAEEAIEIGEQTHPILRRYGEWQLLTGLLSNLATINNQLGRGQDALALLEEARAICHQFTIAEQLPGVEVNYAFVLRSLGQLAASMEASQRALVLYERLGQTVAAAHAQSGLATAYLLSGRYNEALELFEMVQAVHLADQRHYSALYIQLFVTDCLLQLGRYADVLNSCKQIRPRFGDLGVAHEFAKTILNEAIAFAGLKQYAQALRTLDEARHLFQQDNNRVWVAMSDLEKAAVLYRQGDPATCFEIATACQPIFQTNQLLVHIAHAQLIAARAAFALKRYQDASELIDAAQFICEREDIPWQRFQCHQLLAMLARVHNRPNSAVKEYDKAIGQLERLRGRLMIEFRADFLEDKQRVYEEMVGLLLEQERLSQALSYVERVKSRGLVDMLAYRLDLRLQPRSVNDQALMHELQQLRNQRNHLVRDWTDTFSQDKATPREVQQTALQLEQRMTELWHTLLIHNADYARDAALTTVRSEPIQPYLDAQTLLIEYFSMNGELIAFLVTDADIRIHRFSTRLAQLSQLSRLLSVNLKAVPNSQPNQTASLIANAQTQLRALYQLLIAPLADQLVGYSKVIIVPHGPLLHYLPFHALYDGDRYLIEQVEVSYLPSASLLHYIAINRHKHRPTVNAVAFGHSYGGRLPHAVHEAAQIATLLGGESYLEGAAAVQNIQEQCTDVAVIHFAAHGDFNPDNPLFSGLTLADGQLNTLDIFNLKLQASLVTLSACQTGRSVVKGGDELMGLMRAFFYAGADSLVLSHWRVADRATMRLMARFYQRLSEGDTKGQALRVAQRDFIRQTNEAYRHPYYWSSFFLAGDTGLLR